MDEDSGEVICSRPSVSIAKVPATCNLKYDEGTTTLVCKQSLEYRVSGMRRGIVVWIR